MSIEPALGGFNSARLNLREDNSSLDENGIGEL